jgi:hypothetical protein
MHACMHAWWGGGGVGAWRQVLCPCRRAIRGAVAVS